MMQISILDIFSVSVGPSSSHTAGPMRSAHAFVQQLQDHRQLTNVARIQIKLYGSLALTGKGHYSDVAIFFGLQGFLPEDIENIPMEEVDYLAQQKTLNLNHQHTIDFNYYTDVEWNYDELMPLHANGMKFVVFDVNGNTIFEQGYYSPGGGFFVREEDFGKEELFKKDEEVVLPYPYTNASELWQQCITNNKTVTEILLANEACWRSENETRKALMKIHDIMDECIVRGCSKTGVLPGILKLKRRAGDLYNKVNNAITLSCDKNHSTCGKAVENISVVVNLVSAYALAVSEENASGGRIITAPTNGASGVLPAVLKYYKEFYKDEVTEDKIVTFLLVAGAIGLIYKRNASISGAEVGCQGEVGVACSMASGALTAVLGGAVEQIDKSAEIAMEHCLGLTCDPVCGLVQIPCIERNAIASNKAINSTYLVLVEGGEHRVKLDQVVATMLKTGLDMNAIYKETSLGGLAVNVPYC